MNTENPNIESNLTIRDAKEMMNDAVTRCNLTQPANELYKNNPELSEMTKRYVFHISPYIENPLDGRPLIDIAIESAITSYYTVITEDPQTHMTAKHAYIDALLSRASMLLDYEIIFFKINWDPFGEQGVTMFLNQYPAAHIAYGNKIRSASLAGFRQFILRRIATASEMKKVGLCYEKAANSPEMRL